MPSEPPRHAMAPALMPVEVEARFRAHDRTTLERLSAVAGLGEVALGPARAATETDRYLDTADGRLAAAHWACRLRTRGADTRISLKGPPDHGSAGWLHRRPEVEGPASAVVDPREWPDSEARTLLMEISGGAPLAERLVLDQHRIERAVAALGRLSLDAVVARLPDGTSGEFFIVELELVPGGAETALPSLVEALVALEPRLAPEPMTKLELALTLSA